MFSDGPIVNNLDMTCLHDAWPGPNQIGYAVSYALVRMMFESNPRGAIAFLNALKAGKQWERALAEDFGMNRQALVDAFVQQIRERNPRSTILPGVTAPAKSSLGGLGPMSEA